uniref:G domain-containing protein n=2 Tax=Macrostomum lignano TaxID=282301 RepID=A0A1I8IRU2_9PLAT
IPLPIQLAGLLTINRRLQRLASAPRCCSAALSASADSSSSPLPRRTPRRRRGCGFETGPSHATPKSRPPDSLPGYTRAQRDWRYSIKRGIVGLDSNGLSVAKELIDVAKVNSQRKRPVSIVAQAEFAKELENEPAELEREQSQSAVSVESYRDLLDKAGSDLASIEADVMAEAEAADPVVSALIAKGSGRITKHGSEDPTVPVTRYPCHGCGAPLQCANIAFAGFVPAETLTAALASAGQSAAGLGSSAATTASVPGSALSSLLCLRCHLMRKHDEALEASVSKDQWPVVLEAVKKSNKSLLIHIVDLTRLPMTIVPELGKLISADRQLIVVGNKVDLLCRDAAVFEKRWAARVRSYCRQAGLSDVAKVMLVSAKTGYNVERLVSYLIQQIGDNNRRDFYLLGCTNVGKSKLFNSLLNSDLCRVQVEERYHRATVSPLAGTTLGALKFPLIRVTRERLVQRACRLGDEKAAEALLKRDQQPLSALAVMRQSQVGRTFTPAGLLKACRDQQAMLASQNLLESPTYKLGSETEALIAADDLETFRRVMRRCLDWQEIDERQFGRWCFDTPGLAKSYAVEPFLTPSEWDSIFRWPRMPKPRTFIMKPGLSLMIGGLARLDIVNVDAPCAIYVTCHSFLSNIHLVDTDKLEDYLSTCGHLLYSPDHPQRPQPIPQPASLSDRLRRFDCPAGAPESSSADVVFSALAWVSICSPKRVDIAAALVGVDGADGENSDELSCRKPSLQSLAVRLRGHRLPYTKEFRASTDLPEHRLWARRIHKAKMAATAGVSTDDLDDKDDDPDGDKTDGEERSQDY